MSSYLNGLKLGMCFCWLVDWWTIQLPAGLAWHRKGNYICKDAVVKVYYQPIYHQEIINSALALKLFKIFFSFNRGEKYSKLYLCIFHIFISALSSVCLLPIIKDSNSFHMKDRLINVSVLHDTSLKLRCSHYPMLQCLGLLIFPTLWGHRRCATDAGISKPCDGLKKGCLDTKHNNAALAFFLQASFNIQGGFSVVPPSVC